MRSERAQSALEVLRAAERAVGVDEASQGARCRERCSARTCACPGDPTDRTNAAPYEPTEQGYRLAERYGRLLDDFACAGCPNALRCYRENDCLGDDDDA